MFELPFPSFKGQTPSEILIIGTFLAEIFHLAHVLLKNRSFLGSATCNDVILEILTFTERLWLHCVWSFSCFHDYTSFSSSLETNFTPIKSSRFKELFGTHFSVPNASTFVLFMITFLM